MSDTKISAMTPAASMLNADILPIVSAGANFSVSKTLLLTAAAGEAIFVSSAAAGSAVLTTATGQAQTQVNDAFGVLVQADAGYVLQQAGLATNLAVSNLGAVNWQSAGGAATMTVQAGPGSSMVMNDAAGTVVFVCAAGMICPFVIQAPGAIGNWAVGVPADYNLAINRLAAAVAGLLGGAIP